MKATRVHSPTLAIVASLGVMFLAGWSLYKGHRTAPGAPEATTAHAVASPSSQIEPLAPWGAGCNAELLAGPFSLENAVDFEVPPPDLERIHTVIEEVRGGYGGTLVTAPRDEVLDSPAFLAHYLRAFSEPIDARKYDYGFDMILSRLARAESVLSDRNLDWEIWRAFLWYEDFAVGRNDRNSAKDLLWSYLEYNARSIREDPQRLRWWIDSLTLGLRAPGGRPMRRWFLLHLVSLSDTKTAALLEETATSGGLFAVIEPSPIDPFIGVGGLFAADGDAQLPPFLDAVRTIAASQKLSFEVWGIHPREMPPTKAVETNLAVRTSQWAPAVVLSQESWSKVPDDFHVGFSRPIGRRSAHFNVRMPTGDRTDGVFFFTYAARLYVWPKSQMDAGVVRMLHVSQLIDDATYGQFVAKGFEPLATTASGG
jgi:hypothetical protein